MEIIPSDGAALYCPSSFYLFTTIVPQQYCANHNGEQEGGEGGDDGWMKRTRVVWPRRTCEWPRGAIGCFTKEVEMGLVEE